VGKEAQSGWKNLSQKLGGPQPKTGGGKLCPILFSRFGGIEATVPSCRDIVAVVAVFFYHRRRKGYVFVYLFVCPMAFLKEYEQILRKFCAQVYSLWHSRFLI